MSDPMSNEHLLVVMRHAKSSWKTNDPDVSRPLSARGTRDAVVAGHLLSPLGIEHVWCSHATRAQQTLTCLKMGGLKPGRVETAARLYGASVHDALGVVRSTPDAVRVALVVGHEPWASDLVCHLARGSSLLDDVRGKFPTSAVAILRFAKPWAELGKNDAELAAFEVPRG